MKHGRSGRGSSYRMLLALAGLSALGLTLAGAGGRRTGEASGEPGHTTPVASPVDSTVGPTRQVIVYYFHTSFRCASCKRIEAYSGEAIHEGFPAELADGRLQWLPVNTDEKEHEHFVGDFKLYTKSLVLVEVRNGEIARWRNLPKVWELIGDKPAFLKYVRGEVTAFLDAKT